MKVNPYPNKSECGIEICLLGLHLLVLTELNGQPADESSRRTPQGKAEAILVIVRSNAYLLWFVSFSLIIR